MSAGQKVWLIDEGHTGHRVQSEGVLMALSRAGIDFEVVRIECELALRGVLRPAARAIMSRMTGGRALTFARGLAKFSQPGGSPPTLIISSGGRSAFVSRALSAQTGSPNVFVGDPKPFPHNWFKAVLAPVPLPYSNLITTGIVPNTVTQQQCNAAAQAYWRGDPPQNRWTLMIGGASRSHPYDSEDWRDLAHSVNSLSRKYRVKWLISTSRRTGADAQKILESRIAPDAVDEFVLYNREPKRVVLPFLGAGEQVFVTRDSLTMVSEALLSARPVTALVPRHIDVAPDSMMSAVLANYSSWKQYGELSCKTLAEFDPSPLTSMDTHCAAAELERSARDLIRLLNLDARSAPEL